MPGDLLPLAAGAAPARLAALERLAATVPDWVLDLPSLLKARAFFDTDPVALNVLSTRCDFTLARCARLGFPLAAELVRALVFYAHTKQLFYALAARPFCAADEAQSSATVLLSAPWVGDPGALDLFFEALGNLGARDAALMVAAL